MALRAQRHCNAILLNVAAEGLFASPHFTTAATPRPCTTVELTVRALGFPHGAIPATIYTKAIALGLGLCPLELGSHFRLHDREFTLSPCHPFSLTQRAAATWEGRDWTASPHPALLFVGGCRTPQENFVTCNITCYNKV